MQRRILFLVVLVMTLVLLAACGGGEESTPEPIPTNAPAADTAPASAPEAEEAEEAPEADEADTSSEPAVEEAESGSESADEAEAETEASGDSEASVEPDAAAEEDESYPAPAAADQGEAYPQPNAVPTVDPYAGPDSSADGDASGDSGAARTFQVVAAESDASYTVEEEFFGGAVSQLGKDLGFFTAIGVTQEVNGQLTLNLGGAPSLESGDITVDISQFASDDDRRDGRIREKHLQSGTYPIATFVATGIEGAPASYQEGQELSFQLVGDLTIREVTKPTTFDVTAKLEGGTITGVATTQILMTDFGFDPPNIGDFLIAENEVLVTVNLTAREAQ